MTKTVHRRAQLAALVAVAVVWTESAFSEEAKTDKPVRVIDDFNRGVESQIYHLDDEDKKHLLGKTDKDGVFAHPQSCDRALRIRVEPTDNGYYLTIKFCAEVKEEIKISSKKVVDNLLAQAQTFEAQGEYGKAARLYGEVAVRARGFDQELAQSMTGKTVDMASRELDKPSNRTPANDPDETVELAHKIERFQEHCDIPQTRQLDGQTLRKLGEEISIGEHLGSAQER